MKKTIILILTFMPFLFKTYAQNYSSSIGLVGGYAEGGYAGTLNYNYYIDENSFIQGSVYFSANKEENRSLEIPYNIFTVNLGYFRNLYASRINTFNISLGGGVLGGYESINNGENELNNGALIIDKSKFIYGAFLSIDTDVFLSNKLSLVLKANQFYHHNSDLGKNTLFAGAGLRYFLF